MQKDTPLLAAGSFIFDEVNEFLNKDYQPTLLGISRA